MEVIICSTCKGQFTWEGGGDRGNIYSCEEGCGRYICVSCILESKQYKQELEELREEGYGIGGLEEILCLKCIDLSKEAETENI